MKISIINRIQNSLTKMLIPFMISLLYKENISSNLIKYYAIALAVSSVLIFGFPLKINKSLKNIKLFIIGNQIFILYLILVTLLVFSLVSLLFELDYFSFIFIGFYFILSHLYVSLEKYCQYYNLDKKGFYIFLFHNLFLIAFIYLFSFFSFDDIFLFFFILFFISFIFYVYFCTLFFYVEKFSYLDVQEFFEGALVLGQYSLMQNLINRGDSLLLPYLFNTNIFANYYLITRFIDIGGFLVSMFSQLSLVESLKNKVAPILVRYIMIGLFALIISVVSLAAYTLFNHLVFNTWHFCLFIIILLKSIFLYFQDLHLFLSKEKIIRNALCIQFCSLLILIFFLNFFIGWFGVYFYFVFLIVIMMLSLFYLFSATLYNY